MINEHFLQDLYRVQIGTFWGGVYFVNPHNTQTKMAMATTYYTIWDGKLANCYKYRCQSETGQGL